MNEDFVSFELAKKIKEKGFNEPCINAVNKFGCTYLNGWCEYLDDRDGEYITLSGLKDGDYLLPTISQVLKWLREEKKIYCLPHFDQGIDKWLFYIARPNAGCEFVEFISESIYDTYEQAALEGIEYTLNNII